MAQMVKRRTVGRENKGGFIDSTGSTFVALCEKRPGCRGPAADRRGNQSTAIDGVEIILSTGPAVERPKPFSLRRSLSLTVGP